MANNRSVLPIIFAGVAILLFVLTILTRHLVLLCIFSLYSGVLLFVRWSLRDPERIIPRGNGLILSAADGRVSSLERVTEHLFLGGNGIAVGVYLSLFDVHVNRNATSGVVTLLSHKPGKFLPAFRKKSSEYNEQQIIGIENERGRILIKQIAGSVARRIVCHLCLGDVVQAGDRFGMITFGSRVEHFLPVDTEIKVKIGDRVKAGESIIGVLS
jgi:phosphatidylserine decarboxylase